MMFFFVFHISQLPDASPIHTMGKKCQMNDVPDPPLPARPAPDVDVVSKQVSALLIVSYYCEPEQLLQCFEKKFCDQSSLYCSHNIAIQNSDEAECMNEQTNCPTPQKQWIIN